MLGSKSDYPTRRLRELEKRLSVVTIFAIVPDLPQRLQFASRWELLVLMQHKPSTQVTIRSHLRKHLIPHFGRLQMREMELEEEERFVSSVKVSAKTAKNLFATMQMLWKSARAWGYVATTQFRFVSPKRYRVARRFFSLEEMQRILEAASGPVRKFYWLAVETGMRAGELCGLQVGDFDLGRGSVSIRRSVWRGNISVTKERKRSPIVLSFSSSSRTLLIVSSGGRRMSGGCSLPRATVLRGTQICWFSGSCIRCSIPSGSSAAAYMLSVTPTARLWIAWACR